MSPCGDAAMRVTIDGASADEVWGQVHRLAAELNRGGIPGVHSAVPTYDAVLVEFDPCRTSLDEIEFRIGSMDESSGESGSARPLPGEIEVPVCFGGQHGPDLDWVASTLSVTADRVVATVCAKEYRIRCLGGPAASAMMDGPDF